MFPPGGTGDSMDRGLSALEKVFNSLEKAAQSMKDAAEGRGLHSPGRTLGPAFTDAHGFAGDAHAARQAALDATRARMVEQAAARPAYAVLPAEGAGAAAAAMPAEYRQRMLRDAMAARRQELLNQAMARREEANSWAQGPIRRTDWRNAQGERQEQQGLRAAADYAEQESRKSFIQQLAEAGKKFYVSVRDSGTLFQSYLYEPATWAKSFGVDKADPNLMARLTGSMDLIVMRLAKGASPFVEGAADLLDKLGESRPVKDAGKAGAGTAGFLAWGWRNILNEASRGVGGRHGGWGDYLLGPAPGTPEAEKAAKDRKFSMVGLPTAEVGGSMANWYDRALQQSLNLQPGSIENEKLQERIQNMSDRLGGLLEKIDVTLKDHVPSFR